ncbi:hypothetical protein BB8028_0001g07260 [Beauveria bassiana]|uniref:Uncharacterized protein n=1 Tax=Beauveria bassiana TaxID=176275 RepID=A0A2S7XY98_BEABA|nr:hypothetical protein BB8028_0001g07260 [Beauveria bassiana]
MPHIRTQCSTGPTSQRQQYQQPQYNQQNMATNQQSQRHAQHYAHQHMQQASRHRENRDRGVDPSIPTSESDTDQPSVYMSDVRKMAPADKAMESLTTYHVTKLVKKPLTMIERSLNVAKPWEKADIVRRDSLSQDEILEHLDEASRKNTKDMRARIAKYPEALRVQVDKATKNREKSERDCRFVWELVQTDDELVPLPPNTEASDHETPDVKYKGSSRRHEAKRKEMTNSAVWSDSSSATGKRRSDRVAVTLYFKRSPAPGQNPVALYKQLRKRVHEAPPRRDTPPKTVPVPQNEAPAYEPVPVADEYTPPVHHGTRPPPPVPHNTRPAPVPQPNPRPVGVSFGSQQLPKVSGSQQDPRLKQAAPSVPPYTDPRAHQPTQAYQPTSIHSDWTAQAAQYAQASRPIPPHTEPRAQPTQTCQHASLHNDLKEQAAQYAQASRSIPPHTDPRAQPTQAYQPASLHSDSTTQDAQYAQASRPIPPYTEPRVQPRQAYQPASLHSDSTTQDAQYAQASRPIPPYTEPRVQPRQAYQPASLHSDSTAQDTQYAQASQSGPLHTEPRVQPTQTAQTAQYDPVHGEPSVGPTQSGQRAHHRSEPKPKAQHPRSSQPPPMYTDPRVRPAEVPPPSQSHAAKVQLPQAAQLHHSMKPRHRSEQIYEQTQQSRQQAVPQRTPDVPSRPAVHTAEPAHYQSRGASLNGNPASIHHLWNQAAGERRARRQSPRRTHKVPESGESTASHYDDEEEIFSDSGASMESASQYTFVTASPKPVPARPRSDSTARVRPRNGTSSAGTTRTVRDRWGGSPGDARLPDSELNPNGPGRPHARAPQADTRASRGTEKAAEMHSTYSDMETPDPQSWGNVHSRGDDWRSAQAQGSPEIATDHWEDLIYSDSDEADEPRGPSRQFSWQREPRDRNGGRESAGSGGGGRRSMPRGPAPRGNR